MKNLKLVYILIIFLGVLTIYGLGNRNNNEDVSALGKATHYSRTMYLSKDELFDQLNNQEYTDEEIQHAMNNVVTSYKVNALRKASDYYRMDISRTGIFELLISESNRFTKEEAQYAIDHLDEFDN